MKKIDGNLFVQLCLFLTLLLFQLSPVYAHTTETDDVENNTVTGNSEISSEDLSTPGTAFYIELFGKPYLSVNADFWINQSNRFSVAAIVLAFDKPYMVSGSSVFCPNAMYYYLAGKRHRFELGGGISIIPYYPKDLHLEDQGAPVILHGVIGYRYQKKNGLLFRVGFTPLYHIDNVLLPMVGISLGYSF